MRSGATGTGASPSLIALQHRHLRRDIVDDAGSPALALGPLGACDTTRPREPADIVVASRYHGILIASPAQKPLLGITYRRKRFAVIATMDHADPVVEAACWEADLLYREVLRVVTGGQR